MPRVSREANPNGMSSFLGIYPGLTDGANSSLSWWVLITIATQVAHKTASGLQESATTEVVHPAFCLGKAYLPLSCAWPVAIV